MANGRYRWVVLAVSVGAQAAFMGAVFQGIPALRSAYGLSLAQLGFVLASATVGVICTCSPGVRSPTATANGG